MRVGGIELVQIRDRCLVFISVQVPDVHFQFEEGHYDVGFKEEATLFLF